MANAARFTRGSSTYNCGICGRLTRQSHQGDNHLCMQCYDIAGIDNQINDDGRAPTMAERQELDQLLAQIVAKGGDGEAVRDNNGYAFPDAPVAPVVVAPVAPVAETVKRQRVRHQRYTCKCGVRTKCAVAIKFCCHCGMPVLKK